MTTDEHDGASTDADREDGPAGAGEDDRARIARLEAENAEIKDRLLRALADAENLRRRAARDLEEARQYAVARFAGDVVNVADNLERAVGSASRATEGAADQLLHGVALTEKELQRVLERHGVRKLEPQGQPFDPNFHEALFEVEDASVPDGAVATVVEPGYAIGARALRAAKVGVARNRPK
ncbi:nucleotide exchange factor GrpE [Brevundimonas sp. Marseille-Q4549]